MTRLDPVVFCGFHDWTEYGDDDEVLNDDVLSRLFIFDCSRDVLAVRSKDDKYIAFGFPARLDDWAEEYFYWGAFSISYLDGRKKISSANYSRVGGGNVPWFDVSAPTQVFGSWMDDPSSRHYPSPFE